MLPVIDAHIHLDAYREEEQMIIINQLNTYNIKALIMVSNHLSSAQNNLSLATQHSKLKPLIGYHPEQSIPSDQELNDLIELISKNHRHLTGIGEIGLPHYLQDENPEMSMVPHLEMLKLFLQKARQYDLPVNLHAVYDGAPLVCNLLEKYNIKKAHFHWFKADEQTIMRMIENGYYISITPDILYKERTRDLVETYPLNMMMVETDGPWSFEGPFKNKLTHPKMIHHIINEIAKLKKLDITDVYKEIYENTIEFYNLSI